LVTFLEKLAEDDAPPPIDGAYVHFRKAHPEVRAAFALPQVAVQRQSPSDIALGRYDRIPFVATLARIARKLNRRRHRRLKMMEGVSASKEVATD
jgi:glycosyl transferase family 25